jgi:redox-sensitive bicupin YhaK (pirin superfamily)
MQVADMVFTTAATVQLAAEPSWHLLLVVLAGSALVANCSVGEGQMLVLDNQHPLVSISAEVGTRLLWLSGQTLNEPVVGHGPFVMNTRDEIITAITDYQAGLFGQLQ